MNKSTVANPTDFRLLRYFASASLVAFVVAAFALGYAFRAVAIGGLLTLYGNEHVNNAQIIANQMWDDDFAPIVLAGAGKSAAELKAAPQIAALHHKVLRLLGDTKIFKIKVYDLSGMTIYSTELNQIGEDKSKNPGVVGALRGLNSSELVHQNQFNPFEAEVQARSVVESYIPRRDPGTGAVSGVFEIYGDATVVLADIRKRQWTMVVSVMALLSLLYLALHMVVRRAQAHIAEQNRQREDAQRSLALSEERWNFALEGSDAGVWDRNVQTGEVVYSRRYREIYGYGDDQLDAHRQVCPVGEGQPVSHWESFEERVHPDDLPLVKADREAYLTGRTQTYSNERRMLCQDGSWKWILSRGMVVSRDAQGNPLRMIGTHTDISERKALQERMQTLAHYDVLTGLPNRTLFSDRLRQGLAKARRDQTRLALMMIDLDEFKPVNDVHGHQMGDLLLKEVAKRMLECVRRESDTVARLGGDEFVVILSEIDSSQHAIAVAEKIRLALNQIFEIDGHSMKISSCTGVAVYPEHGADEAMLLKSADLAMYRAKDHGRNRVELCA